MISTLLSKSKPKKKRGSQTLLSESKPKKRLQRKHDGEFEE
jgi:hypothetical protein